MKTTQKKHIERNIREIVKPGDQMDVLDRETGKKTGTLTVADVTRDEIRGDLTAKPGWPGFAARFRVPQLTQRGGNTRLALEQLQPA